LEELTDFVTNSESDTEISDVEINVGDISDDFMREYESSPFTT
jgi:hypothetical protein